VSALGLSLRAAPPFVAALAGVIASAAVAAALSVGLGWTRIVSVDLSPDVVPFVIAMLAHIVFFEALPEERCSLRAPWKKSCRFWSCSAPGSRPAPALSPLEAARLLAIAANGHVAPAPGAVAAGIEKEPGAVGRGALAQAGEVG